MCFRIELEFSTEWLQLPRVRYLSQNRGRKRRTIFVPGEPQVLCSGLVESVTFWCQVAPWYISELGIYQRSSGETMERTLNEWFFVSLLLHSMPTPYHALCRRFFTIYSTFLCISESSFCFLYCRQSQVVTRYPFAEGKYWFSTKVYRESSFLQWFGEKSFWC